MRMAADLHYDHLWVAFSVLIAIGAATAALWLAARQRRQIERIGAAGLMGIAIAGMHYAGMRAAIFTAHSGIDLARDEFLEQIGVQRELGHLTVRVHRNEFVA